LHKRTTSFAEVSETNFSSAQPTGRHTSASAEKRSGIHYTPPELARFLASQAIRETSREGTIRVLDPACGDGALLAAVAEAAQDQELVLVGLDQDPSAIVEAERRLRSLQRQNVSIQLHCKNFLDEVITVTRPQTLFEYKCDESFALNSFDLVIANPPYVRTQVLGANMAKELGEQFGLSGRVDLYQAFVVGMSQVLGVGGTMALLCSNRFMTTKSGRDMRKLLATELKIEEVFDLGDTRLFDAAVLPAVVIATKQSQADQVFQITSIYQSSAELAEFKSVDEIFNSLSAQKSSYIQSGGRNFAIRSSKFTPRNWDQPWVAASEAENDLQLRIEANASMRFKDVGKIRVGIKTTSDKVFIRKDWSELPDSVRPEQSLLLPLLTHHVAARWRADEAEATVLYPYDLNSEKRLALDLTQFPGTRAYLDLHRIQLESRTYVVEGGRNWWEIWVPQRPSAWQHRKIVFPDISDIPRFWMDESGSVVNGDCYWMSVPDHDPNDVSLVMLAVANSTLGIEFYDQACGNKLYAGRRRYITQYVSEFPIPDPTSPESRKIAKAVRALLDMDDADKRLDLESEVDILVWRAFGIEERVR
jgi:SAM-dependent methyltransferase